MMTGNVMALLWFIAAGVCALKGDRDFLLFSAGVGQLWLMIGVLCRGRGERHD